MEKLVISDDQLVCSFGIAGLAFESNTHFVSANPLGLCKLASSEGPLISDYVTHETNFAYASYGIHVGQDDRLTFFGNVEEPIIGYFVDCREDSPTKHRQIILEYKASMDRRLIVPRGVAHTFDNLAGVITRDEPVWYMDETNPDYSIDNDLISIPRNENIERFPLVSVNRFRLPDAGHILMSRFQQRVLNIPAGYGQRERVKIGGRHQYVNLIPKTWTDKFQDDFANFLSEEMGIEGLGFSKNNFALTGPNSYTIVPSTSHCVSDILSFCPDTHFRGQFKTHFRAHTILTFLGEGEDAISIDFIDMRRDHSEGDKFHRKQFFSDPRLALTIPAGVAYRMRGEGRIFVRSEQIFLVSADEPREDLPNFGSDIRWFDENGFDRRSNLQPAELKVPDQVTWMLARQEIRNWFEYSNLAKTYT